MTICEIPAAVETRPGFCACGCGGKTNPAPQNSAAKGWVKGQPVKWVRGHQARAKHRSIYDLDGDIALLCTRCKVIKNLDDFYPCRERWTGAVSWCKTCTGRYASGARIRRYGLDIAEHFELGESQDWCCAICRTDEPGGNGDWAIDHSHVTGVVRGLLCSNCNTFIGLARENVETLASAIRYLESHA